MNTHQASSSSLNKFFSKTADRLVGENAISNYVILSHIDSLANNFNSF